MKEKPQPLRLRRLSLPPPQSGSVKYFVKTIGFYFGLALALLLGGFLS